MGAALADGLVAAGWTRPDQLSVVEASEPRRAELARSRAFQVAGTVEGATAGGTAAVVVAVKPGDVEAVCRALAGTDVRRVLSVAAGVRIEALETWLGGSGDGEPAAVRAMPNTPAVVRAMPKPPAVVRAMPNTPALVGAGASAIALGSRCDDDDQAWATGILAAVGRVTTVTEPLLDAVTGLSGSGPAYVFLLAEALIDAGVLAGLGRPVAHELAVQTILGAGRLLAETGDDPAALRAAVTSPGGTTAAGLHALEVGGLRATVSAAVLAAAERSRQLGS